METLLASKIQHAKTYFRPTRRSKEKLPAMQFFQRQEHRRNKKNENSLHCHDWLQHMAGARAWVVVTRSVCMRGARRPSSHACNRHEAHGSQQNGQPCIARAISPICLDLADCLGADAGHGRFWAVHLEVAQGHEQRISAGQMPFINYSFFVFATTGKLTSHSARHVAIRVRLQLKNE